ncbi:unnamed protein product [Caenorhabditis sp. 36 PRJEB53466]|nr:unnamed protein product [Caenorhabditis sp. 36 PRJEB53466]
MIIEDDFRQGFYNHLKKGDKSVVLLVAVDTDALCTTLILTVSFEAESRKASVTRKFPSKVCCCDGYIAVRNIYKIFITEKLMEAK